MTVKMAVYSDEWQLTGYMDPEDVVVPDGQAVVVTDTRELSFTVRMEPVNRELLDVLFGYGASGLYPHPEDEAVIRAAWAEMEAGPAYVGPGIDRLMGVSA
ncbi:hypothetical protein SEA_TINALIN_67 [Gordonia phage TinaLin]|uniref:Uncharacterized protein n=1 Tax=Gordonia phage TinaLin TaxID=2797324 RepID=A0A7T7K8B1_9CAUD|nr:hypothetical protein KDJ60_gp39 [Gordonia phage TinaLin]QQM15155.1 hypothetical protein SEA_TINALIN_67 [Gordonia phage TinaLin]